MIQRLERLRNLVRSRATLFLCLIAAVVFGLTTIPYAVAYLGTPPGLVFGGYLIWPEDQDMYFSFIRQAADGHLLFINRLTSLEHQRVFFELEWLLVGRVMSWLKDSTDWTYQVWRAAGALTVVFGFAALAQVTLQEKFIRRVALLMCVFGGGFQTLCVGLNWLAQVVKRLSGVRLGMIPTGSPYFTAHPYGQILANPHFALPLGVFMLAMAAFVQGERTNKWRWYALAGALSFIEGSMRPYEMIALYVFIPLFVLVEIIVARKIDWRRIGQRTLPLLVVAPVFVYTIFIFELHPIFKYWASQGVTPAISIRRTLPQMGLAVVLLLVRLCLVKKFPLKASSERLLLVWMLTVFFFIHAGGIPMLRFMPYTPQLMTDIMPPVILLGVVVLDPTRWSLGVTRPALAGTLVISLLAINALDSAVLLHKLIPPEEAKESQFYIPSTEMEGYEWLRRESSEDDVVLCLSQTGRKLGRYTSVRTVSGHWSLTPEAKQMEESAERFYRGSMSQHEAEEFLLRCRVKWIYVGQNERKSGVPNMDVIPGFTKRVVNADVTVYSAKQ